MFHYHRVLKLMSITLLALQNLVNSFHGRITVLACGNSRFSSLFAAVELGETAVFAGCQIAGSTCLHVNTFGSPSRVNLVKARQSEHARVYFLARAKFSHINAR